MKKLQGFVGYLTEQQHKRDPTSEVIWYDSLINTGKLEWQDELNEKNRYNIFYFKLMISPLVLHMLQQIWMAFPFAFKHYSADFAFIK